MLAGWRDWDIPVKLAAVTLVPVVFAIVLGAMQIADQVDRASSYRRVDRLVVVNEELRSLVAAVQRERTATVSLLAAAVPDAGTALRDERAAVDTARDAFTRATRRVTLDGEVAAARYGEVLATLRELRGVRQQIDDSRLDTPTAVVRLTAVTDALLRFDRALSAEAIDPRLVAASASLHDLGVIAEQLRYQHALVAAGIERGGLGGTELAELRASLARLEDTTADFHAIAAAPVVQAFDRVAGEQVAAGRASLVATVVASPARTPVPATVAEWNSASEATARGVAGVAELLGRQLRERSAALQDEASDGAGLAAVILLVALVVALGVMAVVGRHLLSSLSALHTSVLEVAKHRLPAAVARIREGGEDADSIALEPVPVTSRDEVGQVARAFEAVQCQALRLASEQAGLRAQYSSVFVNLSRRSQGLVQRQLHLLERLERDEEDADQLATLFQLDHLATRMRRNNENLMVLSGSDVGRRNQPPTTLADLLRAAVSEIEQYQRVVMLPPPSVLVVGYAVGDLVRLVAELLDNATAFSPPETSVTITCHSYEDGAVDVEVLDEGIGMTQDELDQANAKLADIGSIDVTTSRRMGLFVIGRLASRHDIEVELDHAHEARGVRAVVTVPPELIADPAVVVEPSTGESPASGLVPFTPPANGHPRTPAAPGLVGATGLTPSPLPRRLWLDEPDLPQEPAGDSPAETTAVDLWRSTGPEEVTVPGLEPVGEAGSDVAGDGDEPRSWSGVLFGGTEGPAPTWADGEPVTAAEAARGFAPQLGDERDRGSAVGSAQTAGEVESVAEGTVEAGPDDDASAGSGDDRRETPRSGDDQVGAVAAGAEAENVAAATPPPAVDPAEGERASSQRSAADAPPPVDRPGAVTGGQASEDLAPTWPLPGDDLADRTSGTGTGAGAGPTSHPPEQLHPRMPLPRRAPSGRPGRMLPDIAHPRPPLAPPAGLPAAPPPGQPPRSHPAGHRHGPGGWWTPRGPGTPVDPAALAETTPIFDEMVTAWFRAVTDQSEPGRSPEGEPWRFTADAGFQAARTVSRAEPAEFTDTGLPRRNPSQYLVPGSVANDTPAGPPRHGKAAESVRDRLSDYRHGVRRARDHQGGNRHCQRDAPLEHAEDWHFAEPVAGSPPPDFTSGGLPRRVPLGNLVPGSITASGEGPPPRREQAAELRGRLDSFQRGLSRGRRSLAERAATNANPRSVPTGE
ncbi:hypothetical protein BU204_19175 [Actinophytocola xanthii]|uniref:histidine kinase n=1 Tax=Actinophytocola xanthii TaxID=1912961 RepID=A0A1Q8CNW6_9PSEU|nr:hypothetical protein BU204_19175 [Actinophytocola xanthii]